MIYFAERDVLGTISRTKERPFKKLHNCSLFRRLIRKLIDYIRKSVINTLVRGLKKIVGSLSYQFLQSEKLNSQSLGWFVFKGSNIMMLKVEDVFQAQRKKIM